MYGGETALNEHIDEDVARASIPEGERRDIAAPRAAAPDDTKATVESASTVESGSSVMHA